MSNKISLKVSEKTCGTETFWEGVVTIVGVKPSKLTRVDGTTNFPSRSALMNCARNLGKRLNSEISQEEVAAPLRRAAKKNVRKPVKKTGDSTPSNTETV
jgi:hypothetical protein